MVLKYTEMFFKFDFYSILKEGDFLDFFFFQNC